MATPADADAGSGWCSGIGASAWHGGRYRNFNYFNCTAVQSSNNRCAQSLTALPAEASVEEGLPNTRVPGEDSESEDSERGAAERAAAHEARTHNPNTKPCLTASALQPLSHSSTCR